MNGRLFSLLLSLLSVSCTSRPAAMKPAARAALTAPPPEQAQLVFVRPSLFARNYLVTLVDARGRYLGELPAGACFARRVAPGPRLIVAWSGSAAAVEADLAGGRTYFVEVALRAGTHRPRVDLFAHDQHSLALMPAYLAQCERLEPGGPGEPPLDRGRMGRWIELGRAELAGAEEDRSRRRLPEHAGLSGEALAALIRAAGEPPPPERH